MCQYTSTIDGKTVTVIGNSAFSTYYGKLGKGGRLEIPDTILNIENAAFAGRSDLRGDLILPSSLKKIGQQAFEGCSGFSGALTIPDQVTEIGNYAFQKCSGFSGKLTLSKSLTTVGHSTFYMCSGLSGTLIIPSNITCIEPCAFSLCSGLTGDLNLPDTITSIGWSAFNGCSGLNGRLKMPSNLTLIDSGTFARCGFTGTLVIPENVNEIKHDAFYWCEGFSGDLVIPQNVKSIGDHAFAGTGFNGTLALAEGLETIGIGAFASCKGIKGTLNIPNSVKSIGAQAFQDCSGFTGNLVLPGGVNKVEYFTFWGCNGLSGNLTIPENITYIANYSFLDCSGLTGDLNIPENVNFIGFNAFEGCSFNGTLTIPKELSQLETAPAGETDSFYGLFKIKTIINNSDLSIPAKDFLQSNDECFLKSTGTKVTLEDSIDKGTFTRGKGIISVTGVYIDSGDLCIKIGASTKLNVVIKPSNATDKTVTWGSSNKNVATVDKSGNVKGLGKGTTLITATTNDGGYVATCKITVTSASVSVRSIKLKKTASVYVGKTITLTPSITPNNATNKGVTWKSSNKKIATVDKNGRVKGVKSGKATITVTTKDGKKTATCKVTVGIKVKNITLDHKELTLEKGKSKNLKATITPDNATDKSITWKSSDKTIATVSSSGKIKAKKPGTVKITATANGGNKTAVCKVKVIIPVKKVELDQKEAEVAKGACIKLNATILPKNATNKKVTWKSSNTKVAKVDKNGGVDGISNGTATITVTTKDGGKQASCEVTVKGKTVKIKNVTLDKSKIEIPIGGKETLEATLDPKNATYNDIYWVPLDKSIASVKSTGKLTAEVTGLKEGKTKIMVVVHYGFTNVLTCECEVNVTRAVGELIRAAAQAEWDKWKGNPQDGHGYWLSQNDYKGNNCPYGAKYNGNWCGCFVSECLRSAGVVDSSYNENDAGLGKRLVDDLKIAYYVKDGKPMPGDIVEYYNPTPDKHYRHVAIVESVVNNKIMTFQGNVNNSWAYMKVDDYKDKSPYEKSYQIRYIRMKDSTR